MFSSLLQTSHTPIKKFIEILIAQKFNQRSAEKMIVKVNKNYQFEDGNSLLDMCLQKKRFKAASWLVQQNVKITDKNKHNISTVRYAIEQGQIVIVDEIVKNYDLNINQVDSNGRSLLQDAVILGHDEISKILISKNINPNIIDNFGRNAVFDAINYGDMHILDIVLSIKDVDLNIVDKSGRTVLHQKSVLDNDKLAIKLLEKGANPTISDPDGYSYLTHVALRGDSGKEILDIAVKHGCDLNAKSLDQSTVLMEVMRAFTTTPKVEIERRSELKDMAQNLVEKGSDVNSLNQYNESILFRMIRRCDYEGCSFALKNGAMVNIQNSNQETPLLLAVIQGKKALDIISLLLEHEADPFITNSYDQTVFEVLNGIILDLYKFKAISIKEYIPLISSDGQYLVVLKELLLALSGKINILDSFGNPLFFTPFLYGEMNIIKLYLQFKVDINQINKNGHNLFYEYVLRSFHENTDVFSFKEKLVFLLVNGSDITCKNHAGQTIYTKVATMKNANLKLFRKLVELTKHDYYSVDNEGRTIIHACVFSNNVELMNLVYGVERNIQDIVDNYNILPITYAAIMGRQEIVIEFLKKDTKVTSGKPILLKMKKKFQPFLENLPSLLDDIEDPVLLRQLEILTDQVRKDLTL